MVTCHADVMEAIKDVVRWTRDCPFPFRTCDHVEWLATHGRNLLASMSSHADPTEREELFKVLEAHDERGSLALLKPMLV
jgi:hypothetical protein